MDQMQALLKKEKDELTEEERKSVEDYLLDRAPPGEETSAPKKKPDVAMAARSASQGAVEAASTSEQRRLMGQKQMHQDMWKGAIERSVEGQRQAPGQAPRTDTEFASLREINEEIENLQNRRNSSMNSERARQLEEEIQRLEERRSKMPGGRQPPSDMEDEGARTSYEDYLLRN
tara:strand:+ start:89 stop:613 length:525 start_codon:yes stop_codon:yes gene_type:complete